MKKLALAILLAITTATFAGRAREELAIKHEGVFATVYGNYKAMDGVMGQEFNGKRSPSRKIKGAWLGVTAVVNGTEIDFSPREVNGKFKVNYTISATQLAKAGGGSPIWIAKLYQFKINKATCELNGSACSYCKKNGCHLDGDFAYAREEVFRK